MSTAEQVTFWLQVGTACVVVGVMSWMVLLVATALAIAGRDISDEALDPILKIWPAVGGFLLAGATLQFAPSWYPFWYGRSWLFLIVPLAFLALLTLFFFHMSKLDAYIDRLKGRRGEAIVRKEIEKTGFQSLHDVYVEAGGRVSQIDHVVRAGGAWVAVETKNWRGDIRTFGDTWKISGPDGKPQDVDSPIGQSRGHASTLSDFHRSAVVKDVVVFTSRGSFPNGMPVGTVMARNLGRYLAMIAENHPEDDLSGARWDALAAHVRADVDGLKARHAERLERIEVMRSVPMLKKSCRNCGSPNVTFGKRQPGYSTDYWRCGDCDKTSPIYLPPCGQIVDDGDEVRFVDSLGNVVVLQPGSKPAATVVALEEAGIPPEKVPRKLPSMRGDAG